MVYRILKPEITDIWDEVWNMAKVRWQFWCLLVVSFVASAVLGMRIGFSDVRYIIPFFAVVLYLVAIRKKVASLFWKRFAEVNGWEYASYGNPDQEIGIMFRQGYNRKISNIINGRINGGHFRIFNYEFDVLSARNNYNAQSKRNRTRHYTVFAFKFNGSFPHIYLNNRRNSYNVNIDETVPLPAEFKNKFSLSVPRKYEIEALAIFTPDILASLIDSDFVYDVEFVNQEMIVFIDGQVNYFRELEIELDLVLKLKDLFGKKLDRFKFQPIGDMPHTL